MREMEKKRYILFGIMCYYPGGGMDDAMFSFDSRKDLEDSDWDTLSDHYQVFDTETFETKSGETPLIAFDRLEQ